MTTKFIPKSRLTDVAKNVLRKRYFHSGEKKWKQVAQRVVNHVCKNWNEKDKDVMYDIIYNRYFLPNSPTLVNSGKSHNAGLSACYVVPFEDKIEEIYKTKLDFALIARSGGGCGTTLSNLRPKNSIVNGSTHGYAGGPIGFFDTICKDMEIITQSGFRNMAMMGVMSIYHPDILDFINAKESENRMTTTNISVMVDNEFMKKVENDEEYWTEFRNVKYNKYKARDVFNLIVECAWRNGEPKLNWAF